MKLLLVGTLEENGATNSQILGQMFNHYNVQVEYKESILTPKNYRKYDAVIIVGCSGSNLRIGEIYSKIGIIKNLVAYVVGTDIHRVGPEGKHSHLPHSKHVHMLYVTDQLKETVGVEGPIIPIPINTKHFYLLKLKRQNDILYYCPPNKPVYCPEWIEQYKETHPEEKITILTGKTPYQKMPIVYNTHKKLIRMTKSDGYPKMPYEALLCGCEVWWNDKHITEIPSEMRMENTIPKLIEYLEGLQ